MFVWYNVRCLFVTLYCCIEYNVIIDCNGQANVLVSAIKMQASFCSHGQTCVFVCQWMCIFILCVGMCWYELNWLKALWMMATVYLRKFLELQLEGGTRNLEELQVLSRSLNTSYIIIIQSLMRLWRNSQTQKSYSSSFILSQHGSR